MIEALIFDCDGTLTDSMRAHYSAWKAALDLQGMHLPEQEFYRHGGTPSSKVIPMLAKAAGCEIDFDRAILDKEDLFLQRIESVKSIPIVVEIAANCLGKLPMAVASGGTRNLVHRQLKQISIFEWFDTIVTCEDTHRHKPDPDVFLEAARRLGVAPKACRVYEDGDAGIQAAGRAGMECVDVRRLIDDMSNESTDAV